MTGSEPAEAFHGGAFDGRRIPHRNITGDRGIVGSGGELYVRAPELDTGDERAWKYAPGRDFAAEDVVDVDVARRPDPVALSTMSVKAAGKDRPVTLGQLRALGERAAEQGFSDDTPVRALVFMRGTVKALEVRAD